MFKMETKMYRVRVLLQSCPETRDDDELLLLKYADSYGAVTLSDTITRARRKLQQEDRNLRGKQYNERHGIKVDAMQMELGYNVKP